jgi:hypothetical protein|nr:MAG TPA: hypothetical protein [Caudoviricetes sp.]
MKTVHEGMIEQRFFPASKLSDRIEIQPGELICVKYAKYNILFQNDYKTLSSPYMKLWAIPGTSVYAETLKPCGYNVSGVNISQCRFPTYSEFNEYELCRTV